MEQASFARQAPGVDAAELQHKGEYVQVYRGTLDGTACRFFVLQTGVERASVRSIFTTVREEVKTCSSHRGTAAVVGINDTPCPWIALEELNGRSLGPFVQNAPAATIRDAVADLAELAQYTYNTDCTHLRLIPQGIRIVADDDGPRGRIVDWGFDLNCQIAAETAKTSFLPPETYRPAPVEPGPALVYGLAAVIYTAFRGHPPDPTETADSLPARDTDSDERTIPNAFVPILTTALRENPADRYNSPYELKRALLFDTPSVHAGGDKHSQPEHTTDTQTARARDSQTNSPTDQRETISEIGTDAAGEVTAENDSVPEEITESRHRATASWLSLSRRSTLGILGAGILGGGGLLVALSDDENTPSLLHGSDQPETTPIPTATRKTTAVSETDDSGAVPAESSGRSAATAPVAITAPELTLRFSYDSETLTVIHRGGDEIQAGQLLFRGSGFAGSPQRHWSDSQGLTPKTKLSTGNTVEFAAESDVAIRAYWDGGDDPVFLTGYAGPDRPHDDSIDGWPGHQYDSKNTGNAATERGPTALVESVWEFEVPGSIRSSPVVSDGILYTGTTAGLVYAVDAADGTELWRFRADGQIRGAPTAATDTVYVATNTGMVYAIDATDGTEQWRFEATNIVTSVVTAPVGPDGTVYVVSEQTETTRGDLSSPGVLFALDAADGTPRWQFDSVNSYSMPAVEPSEPDTAASSPNSSSTVYVGDNRRIRALDALTGTEQWSLATGRLALTAPTVAVREPRASSIVFLGSIEGDLYAVNTDSGTLRWTYGTDSSILISPAVIDTSQGPTSRVTLYAGTASGSLYAIDGLAGTPRWKIAMESERITAPVIAKETIYLSTGVEFESGISALDAVTGSELFRFESNEARRLSVPAVVDGRLYVGSGLPALHKTRQESHWSTLYALR